MNPDALRRLLADLPVPASPHPVDAGLLGEYAFVARARGPSAAAEEYPRLAEHLRGGCRHCQDTLSALSSLAQRTTTRAHRALASEPMADQSQPPTSASAASPESSDPPEPIEIAEAIALARSIEAERESLRAPLRPDQYGQVESRRQSARRRLLLLVEVVLTRQRLVARRLFLDRALAQLIPRHSQSPSLPRARGRAAGGGGLQPNPKAHLLLDDFASGVDDLARLTSRVGRVVADLRRLGDEPQGPARSQSEALTDRGLGLTRDALAVDRRLARLQGSLAGMVT